MCLSLLIASTRVTVLVVDDHPRIRQGMSRLLQSRADMEVVETAATTESARKRLRNDPPDLLVTDLSLPDGSGLDLIRWARDRWPELPILVVSTHKKAVYGPKARQAGADGYLSKTDAPIHLPQAARQVARGGPHQRGSLPGAGPETESCNCN